jgi:hypothetical protein
VPVQHPAADVLAERRVVDDVLADVRRPIVDLVAAGLQPGDQAGFQGDAVVVGCDRDPDRFRPQFP